MELPSGIITVNFSKKFGLLHSPVLEVLGHRKLFHVCVCVKLVTPLMHMTSDRDWLLSAEETIKFSCSLRCF